MKKQPATCRVSSPDQELTVIVEPHPDLEVVVETTQNTQNRTSTIITIRFASPANQTQPEASQKSEESSPGESGSGQSQKQEADATGEQSGENSKDESGSKQSQKQEVDATGEQSGENSEDESGSEQSQKQEVDATGKQSGENSKDESGSEQSQKQEAGASGEQSGENSKDDGAEEQSEKDKSQAAEDLLKELMQLKDRDETGHRSYIPERNYKSNEVQLQTAFKQGAELIRKLATELDFSQHEDGTQYWSGKSLAKAVVSRRVQNLEQIKQKRPFEADLVVLFDLSPSCEDQSKMFMSIAAGAAGGGINNDRLKLYVGANGSAHATPLSTPKKAFLHYHNAEKWIESKVAECRRSGEITFAKLIETTNPRVCIIFGDKDGIDQYRDVLTNLRHRHSMFFWFSNEGTASNGRTDNGEVPDFCQRSNYFPGVYTPGDLVRALRKVQCR